MLIEGVVYEIDWKAFRVGRSIFLPCLNVAAAKAEVRKVTHRLKVPVVYKWEVCDGVGGLRVWRV